MKDNTMSPQLSPSSQIFITQPKLSASKALTRWKYMNSNTHGQMNQRATYYEGVLAGGRVIDFLLLTIDTHSSARAFG